MDDEPTESLWVMTIELTSTDDIVRDFNQPAKCWRNNTAVHKESRRFLENINDKFLTKVTVEPTKTGALLDLVLTNKEDLIEDVNIKGRLGSSNCEMVELRILRGRSKAKSGITTLNFRRAEFGLFRNLLQCVPWNKALEGRGAQESWLIFKGHLL
ncbi:glycerol kinase [Limosa lapponica baueri]|uniref:Glycerol kinase n=1 Tax=Limosa lapponica baueri TaxID=1758121 RepID=A0A2I0TNF6_LIMLA|nr:glycerol kinase [Limosa lapponica baueri]